MAASTFFNAGLTEIGTIEEAHRTLEPLLGSAASWIFAISLLASGLSSSSVGTMAGQVIMQGFLHVHIPAWVRRLVTMFPSLIVIFIGFDPNAARWSSVRWCFRLACRLPSFRSLCLPAAVILWAHWSTGESPTSQPVLPLLLIIALNLFLLYQVFFGA